MIASRVFKRLIVLAAISLELASCAGSSTQPASSALGSSQALVRFVNASPDAAYQDPLDPSLGAPLNASYVMVDGAQIVTIQAGPAYVSSPGFNGVPVVGSVSAYVTIPAGAKSVSFAPLSPSPGTSGSVGPFTIPQLTSGHRYTLVLAGSYCLKTLTLYTFDDGAVSPAGGTLAVYHAAPDASASFDFGYFNASDTSGASNQMAGTAMRAQRAAVAAPNFTNGFGVYVGTGTQATIGTILPSAIDAFDVSNVLPYNALTTLSVFIADTAQRNFGGAILCANESFGAPNIVGALGP